MRPPPFFYISAIGTILIFFLGIKVDTTGPIARTIIVDKRNGDIDDAKRENGLLEALPRMLTWAHCSDPPFPRAAAVCLSSSGSHRPCKDTMGRIGILLCELI